MNLGEYVTLVCTKCRRTDEATRSEARIYIRNKYRTIYESKPWRDVSGVIAVNIPAGTQITILPRLVDRVIACRWSDSVTLENTSPYEVLSINPHLFDQVGDPLSFSIISPSAVKIDPLGQKIRLTTGSTTPDFKVTVYGSLNGDKNEEVISMTGNATVQSMLAYDEIYSLSMGERTSDVQVKRADDGKELLFLKITDTEKRYQRLHFYTTSVNPTTAIILHKRSFQQMIDDSASPEIMGIESALEEFALYDMRVAERQYSMANAHLQAASAAVGAMADLERHQSAHKVKIIPWMGLGEQVSVPGKGYWW